MKTTAIFWVWMTTALLLVLTVMSAMAYPFALVFYLTVLGQALLVYMVFRVLTDPYKTSKTFDDWYQDVDRNE